MAVGLTTICNAHGSMAELPADSVWKLEDEFTQVELIDALTTLSREPSKRQQIGRIARQTVQRSFAPWHCAELYHESIEAFYGQPTQARRSVVESLASKLSNLPDLILIADALERSVPNTRSDRQLLVDITALMTTDLQTGIQRVVRSVLKCLLESPPKGFRVEPVYTSFGAHGYFYARQFTKKFLQIDIDILADDPVLMLSEDIFLGLDLCLSDVYEQRHWFEQAQQCGALVYFVAYDLLPVTHPHWFPASEQPIFEKWLKTITEFDGVISISKATADELKEWMKKFPRQRELPFSFGVAHIGADIAQSKPTKGLPFAFKEKLIQLKSETTFLMVGTIEPRKGHAQALDAFECLWASGLYCQLVIVGKPGWNVTKLIERINKHPQRDYRLFWFEGISDEFLEMIYTSCSCLLAASEAEGFGLPVIEAAKHGLPVLARDIPIFREIAQNQVNYFSANNGLELSQEIDQWLKKYAEDRHTKSSNLVYSSWSECTERFKEFLVGPQPYSNV
jgi:glycosyltransferase involved in cell wall biosynthesis